MRVFVTGATGYIGLALCRRLVADGHELTALVRPTSHTEELAELGVACHVGDITDRYSMRPPMSGADWVIHAAAELDFAAPTARIRDANLEGSRNVASLAHKLGVGRLLLISSVARFGGSPVDGSPGDEDSPVRDPPSRYAATKYAGEQAARELVREGLRLNVVYPSLVYGPPRPKGGANVLLRGVLKRRWPALVGARRRMSWIYLDDLVDGMVRLMARAEPGRDFLMTGDAERLGAVVDQVAALGGVAPPRLRLPLALGRALAAVTTPLYRARGYRPPLSSDQLRSLDRDWYFSDRRAREELGLAPRTLAEGLPPTVDYLLASMRA